MTVARRSIRSSSKGQVRGGVVMGIGAAIGEGNHLRLDRPPDQAMALNSICCGGPLTCPTSRSDMK